MDFLARNTHARSVSSVWRGDSDYQKKYTHRTVLCFSRMMDINNILPLHRRSVSSSSRESPGRISCERWRRNSWRLVLRLSTRIGRHSQDLRGGEDKLGLSPSSLRGFDSFSFSFSNEDDGSILYPHTQRERDSRERDIFLAAIDGIRSITLGTCNTAARPVRGGGDCWASLI